MAYITGEYRYPKNKEIVIQVLKPERGEYDFRDGMRLDFECSVTGGDVLPDELTEMAEWIIDTVKTIKAKHNKNGSLKSKLSNSTKEE